MRSIPLGDAPGHPGAFGASVFGGGLSSASIAQVEVWALADSTRQGTSVMETAEAAAGRQRGADHRAKFCKISGTDSGSLGVKTAITSDNGRSGPSDVCGTKFPPPPDHDRKGSHSGLATSYLRGSRWRGKQGPFTMDCALKLIRHGRRRRRAVRCVCRERFQEFGKRYVR